MDMFKQYMAYGNTVISRAEFERNLFLKKTDPVFTKDIDPLILLNTAELYSIDDAYSLLSNKFLPHLDGDPWKGS